MSYATLMVYVDVEAELGGRIAVAADLAQRFQAHLIGIAAWAPMSVFLVEEARNNPAPTDVHLQDMKALLDKKGAEFRATVGSNGRRAEWRSVLDFPTDVVAREARAADLLVVGNAREGRDQFRAFDPAGVLLKAGRPILVVPPAVTQLTPRRIAIAWKDVREARRAVQDALPFLQQAESVMIVEVSEGDEGDQALRGARDVSKYLGRHGMKIITERVRPSDVTAANSLLRIIGDENISLIVAGAYGHSRLGEWVFGGATQELMAESPICCLFSH
jgi:nucleotide-binding universal stress UspA family protein